MITSDCKCVHSNPITDEYIFTADDSIQVHVSSEVIFKPKTYRGIAFSISSAPTRLCMLEDLFIQLVILEKPFIY